MRLITADKEPSQSDLRRFFLRLGVMAFVEFWFDRQRYCLYTEDSIWKKQMKAGESVCADAKN